MSERLPDFLKPPAKSLVPQVSEEGKALLIRQFEMVLPRVLEDIAAGSTLKSSINELPIAIDRGAFLHWLRKRPELYALYKEAKEIRTETWADEIIKHAKGENTMEDVSRSRLVVDTYKFLMGAHNRKEYGDTKAIEINQNISIKAALEQAQSRVINVVAREIDDEDDFS